MDLTNGFWVFGYGSLMWNPGFAYLERVPATLYDYARSFCMWSIHHRGTPDEPGLVLALDAQKGASCRGLAFHIGPDHADAALQELRERELVSSAYVEHVVTLDLDDGRRVSSLAYVVDPDHVQYTGSLSLERQADVIHGAHGGRGPNREYLYNTASHLAELDMEDPELTQLAEMVRKKAEFDLPKS